MRLYLTRYGSTPYGTFGSLIINGEEIYTVEKPWANNRPYVSCVPYGEYKLIWQPTTTSVPPAFDGGTWYLDGETVSADAVSDKLRKRCAIHIGNTCDDVTGCIAPGLALSLYRGKWSVSNSTAAMRLMLQVLGKENHELEITGSLSG